MTNATAGEVTPGDTLLDLDNGFVVEVEGDTDGYSFVTILFHDRNGDECTLSVPTDHPLNVRFGDMP